MNQISFFRGEFAYLSNFHTPAWVSLNGVMYPSVEHAYQAAKTIDPSIRKRFLEKGLLPGGAKRLGRSLLVRPDWDSIKTNIMKSLVLQKFIKPELGDKLLGTEEKPLVEGNYWHDNFWGACLCSGCDNKHRQNHLGLILMETRDLLRKTSRDRWLSLLPR